MIQNKNTLFKKVRINQSLSQEDFGKKLGISRSTVAKIEANKQILSEKTEVNLIKSFPNDPNLENLRVKSTQVNTQVSNHLNTSIHKNSENLEIDSEVDFNENAWKLCVDKANELYDIHDAILKVLNITRIGKTIRISKKELDVLNSFKEIGFNKIMDLSFDGLLNNNTDYKSLNYKKFLDDMNISLNIANKMLLNYIDEAQYIVFNDKEKRPYLIYAENFLED